MGKSGNLRHLEPKGPDVIQAHSKCLEWFAKVGWNALYFDFKGSEYGVAQAFAESFDGSIAQVGDLMIQFLDEFITESTKHPMDGEQWFKNKSIIGVHVNQFLKTKHKNKDLSKGVQRKWLKDY